MKTVKTDANEGKPKNRNSRSGFLTKTQMDSLSHHGLSVTQGVLHGLPVMLLALDKKPTKTAKLTTNGKPQGLRRCYLKRPPFRPLRS